MRRDAVWSGEVGHLEDVAFYVGFTGGPLVQLHERLVSRVLYFPGGRKARAAQRRLRRDFRETWRRSWSGFGVVSGVLPEDAVLSSGS